MAFTLRFKLAVGNEKAPVSAYQNIGYLGAGMAEMRTENFLLVCRGRALRGRRTDVTSRAATAHPPSFYVYLHPHTILSR